MLYQVHFLSISSLVFLLCPLIWRKEDIFKYSWISVCLHVDTNFWTIYSHLFKPKTFYLHASFLSFEIVHWYFLSFYVKYCKLCPYYDVECLRSSSCLSKYSYFLPYSIQTCIDFVLWYKVVHVQFWLSKIEHWYFSFLGVKVRYIFNW